MVKVLLTLQIEIDLTILLFSSLHWWWFCLISNVKSIESTYKCKCRPNHYRRPSIHPSMYGYVIYAFLPSFFTYKLYYSTIVIRLTLFQKVHSILLPFRQFGSVIVISFSSQVLLCNSWLSLRPVRPSVSCPLFFLFMTISNLYMSTNRYYYYYYYWPRFKALD